MLNILRHKGVAKKVLWFITVIIVLSFGVFGVASRLDNTVNSAGKIYGHNVSLREFERAWRDSRDQAIMLYGDQFFKVGSQLDLEKDAWDRLVLLHEAKKQKIKVGDDEVVAAIAALPFFQKDGKFDQSTYDMLVRNPQVFGRKPHEFEEGVRGRLIIKKMLDNVTGPLVMTDEEIKTEYAKRNEKIKLDYVIIRPGNFPPKADQPLADSTGIDATAAEIKAYYDQNKEAFRLPATINVQYVTIAVPAKVSPEQKEKIKKDAQTFSKLLTPSADFAAAAKQAGYEAKESGPFTKDQPLLTFAWSPELVEKLFAMKTGEVTALLEMPDGWQIAKVKEIKPSQVPDFESIKENVKKAAVGKKEYAQAEAKAEESLKSIQEALKKGQDFKAAAQALGLTVQETPEFSRGEYNPSIGVAAYFQEASLKLNENNKISPVVATNQGPAIAFLTSVTKIKNEDFEAEKENYRQMLSARRRSEIVSTFVTKLKLDAKLQIDLQGKIRH